MMSLTRFLYQWILKFGNQKEATLPLFDPIILGTFGSKWGRQRVADLADGWVPIGLFSENMHADIEDLNSRLIKNGRELSFIRSGLNLEA